MMIVEKDNYKYDKATHKKIMSLVENVFKNSSVLVEWNMYIENLLREIRMVKKSGGFRKTRKMRKYVSAM
jgi:hypothetical protein